MCNCVCFKKGHKLICDSVHCLTQRCPVGINITVQYVVFLNKKKKKIFFYCMQIHVQLKKNPIIFSITNYKIKRCQSILFRCIA